MTFLSLKPVGKLRIANFLAPIVLFPVQTVTNYLQFLDVTSKRIERLEREIEMLKHRNTELIKNQKYNSIDPDTASFELIKSRILGRDPLNINGYLTVDRGSNHGVKINQAVISRDGLVGRIKHVSSNESIVETIENNAFAVSAIDQNTDVHGVVIHFQQLQFEYIRNSDEIFIKDTIVTSGMSEIFPAGIVIGFVKEIEPGDDLFFKTIHLEPAARVNRLYYVYIINDRKDEIRMTEP